MKHLRTIILTLALVLSLGLNVATVSISSVANVVSALFSALTGATSVVSELRRNAAQKAARVASLTGELDTVKQTSARLVEDVRLKDGKIATLTAQMENPTVAYRGQRRLLSEAVGDTVGRVSRRTVVAASRNVSSVVAQGIPFAGVGVAIAVTGYELKDGCDTLVDLRELELSLNPSAVLSEEESKVCGMEPPTLEQVWGAVKSSPGDAWASVQQYVPELPDLDLTETASDTWERVGDGLSSTWRRMFDE